MFAILSKYKELNCFRFNIGDTLSKVCTAPNDKAGVYLVYNVNGMVKELVYVGASGHITNEGKIHVRKTGLGGLWGRIVNGKQFGSKRFKSWPKQMVDDKMATLEVQWFVTHSSKFIDSPCYVEHCLLQQFFNENQRLPKWNKKF